MNIHNKLIINALSQLSHYWSFFISRQRRHQEKHQHSLMRIVNMIISFSNLYTALCGISFLSMLTWHYKTCVQNLYRVDISKAQNKKPSQARIRWVGGMFSVVTWLFCLLHCEGLDCSSLMLELNKRGLFLLQRLSWFWHSSVEQCGYSHSSICLSLTSLNYSLHYSYPFIYKTFNTWNRI